MGFVHSFPVRDCITCLGIFCCDYRVFVNICLWRNAFVSTNAGELGDSSVFLLCKFVTVLHVLLSLPKRVFSLGQPLQQISLGFESKRIEELYLIRIIYLCFLFLRRYCLIIFSHLSLQLFANVIYMYIK